MSAPDGKPGAAEGFSGLKAFFYAGACRLLVSHWRVDSAATVPLTTVLLKEYSDRPELGKAVAQRKAILALINTPKHAEYVHPYFWAPFVVVGQRD
jgi:CHAT domain-containing protein